MKAQTCALLTALAALAGVASAAPIVSDMPSFTQRSTYGKAAMNESTTVWARAWNLNGNATYTIAFGDGTSNATGSVTKESNDATRSDYIGVSHTFASAGSKTVTITVTDTTGSTSRQCVVRVLPSPTHYDRVDMAIEKGLLYLYKSVVKTSATDWYWYASTGEYGDGITAFSALAMEENGHSPFNDPVEDVYAYILQRAHTHMLAAGGLQAISNHSDGIAVRSSDKNGNGKGAYFNARTYSDCAVAMALMNPFSGAVQAQKTYIPSGSPFYSATGVYDTGHAYSYYDLMQDFTDTLLWSQGDGTYRGAFEYSLGVAQQPRFDGSAQQWPALAMQMAKDVLAVDTPQWWKDNAVAGLEALMNPTSGGVGYSSNSGSINSGKTGGGLTILKLGGQTAASTDGVKLVSYLQNTWNDAGAATTEAGGWAGYWYGMYGIKKGLALQGVTNLTVGGASRDWYLDMSGWLLGNASVVNASVSPSQRNASNLFGQAANGSWTSSTTWVASTDADTAVSVLTLTRSVTSPPPVPQIAAIPQQSTVGPFSIVLDGTGSYSTDPNRSIVEYLWDFDSSDGLNWTTPDASGSKVTVSPAYLHSVGTHTITLRVTDNSTPTPQTATTTMTVTVVSGDVAPVAVPTASNAYQGYNGQPGASITLDGSKSYDVNGDAITAYSWDLNGDGTFGDATGAQVVFSSATPYTGSIGLKVTANGLTSLPVYVDVQVSATNLSLGTITASNLVAGTSVDLSIPVTNDSASGLSFSNVTLRLYNGNPFSGGVPLASSTASTTVSLGVGETKTVTMTGVQLGGAGTVYAFIDPLNTIPESNKNDNVSFCIGKSPQTITFGPLNTYNLNDADFTLGATASSGLDVSYVSSNTAVATIVNGNQIHIVGAGTTYITASQPGDATYQAASDVVQLLMVSRYTQVITFPALPTLSTSSPDTDPGATSNDPNATVTYTSSNTAVATIVNGKIHPVAPGTCTITANAAADAQYLAATPVQQTLTVVANTLQSITRPSDATYKESDVLTFTVTWLLPVTVTGTPSLDFIEGTTTRHATYVSGSGTTTLTFKYTVVSADFDSDGITITSPLNTSGGTINNQGGGAAPLSFTPPATPNVKIGGMIYFTSAVNNAPDTNTGMPNLGFWDSIRSGMVMAPNGALAFRAHLDLATAGVTVDNYQGIWKSPLGTSASTILEARSGSVAPDTGNAVWDILPDNPYINNSSQLTFVGYLRVNTGTPAVTTSTDSCVWSEIGGTGLHKVIREGDMVAGSMLATVAPNGWFTVSDAGTMAFAAKLTSGGTAMLRATASGATYTVSTIVKDGTAAPDLGGGTNSTFVAVSDNTNDPRMNPATGDLAFFSYLASGGSGIWYQTAAGALSMVAKVGETTPTMADTFVGLDRPSYSSSTMYFRAFLGSGPQSVWKGNPAVPSSFTCIAKTNDTAISGVPAGSKLWSVWAPFSNSNAKVTFRVSLFDGTSEGRAIVTDTDGTLKVIAKVGDTAPGTGGQTFVNFDNPVIGDGNQVAFIASTNGGIVGLFRQAANGGALSLLMKLGDTIQTATGPEIITQFILPGGASNDRLNEVKTVDSAGRVLVHATYQSGKTGILLTTP